jgi:hypothetical protein
MSKKLASALERSTESKKAHFDRIKPASQGVHPYGNNDPIPVPEVIAQDTETVWGLWQATVVPSEDFPKTQPAELTLVEVPQTNFSRGSRVDRRANNDRRASTDRRTNVDRRSSFNGRLKTDRRSK